MGPMGPIGHMGQMGPMGDMSNDVSKNGVGDMRTYKDLKGDGSLQDTSEDEDPMPEMPPMGMPPHMFMHSHDGLPPHMHPQMGMQPHMGMPPQMGMMSPLRMPHQTHLGLTINIQTAPRPPMAPKGPLSSLISSMAAQARPSPASFDTYGEPGPMNKVPGPLNMPARDLQDLMAFEANLQHVRSQLIKSFYADLLAFRALSDKVQDKLLTTLAAVKQVESQMGMPLRGHLARAVAPHNTRPQFQ